MKPVNSNQWSVIGGGRPRVQQRAAGVPPAEATWQGGPDLNPNTPGPWAAPVGGTHGSTLAAVLLMLGLLTTALLAEPLSGGQFSLNGAPVTGVGESGGGTFAVAGGAGETATGPLSGGAFQVTGGLIGVAVVPGDVALAFTMSDGQVTLTWPAEATGFMLEFTPNVGDFADWQPVTPAPTGNTFTTPFNQPLRFFRLRGP